MEKGIGVWSQWTDVRPLYDRRGGKGNEYDNG